MKKNGFLKGMKDGVPIALGYLSVSFAFGIFAVENGLSVLQAVLISILNVTSAGQLAGVPIISVGGMLSELAATQLVINLRYALMSVSLSQKLGKDVKLFDRFVISFVNTDEVFAVAMSQHGALSKKYLYGLILTPYIGWSFGTLVGAVAGNILPAIITSSLGVAIYGMFCAIVVPQTKKDRATAFCVLFAAVLSCAFYYIPWLHNVPSGFSVILCAVAASALMAYLHPVQVSDEEDAA